MSQPASANVADIPRRILTRIGQEPRSLSFLARGMQALVWRAETDLGVLAVRVGAPRPGETTSFEADFGVRATLIAIGGRVPSPIAVGAIVDDGGIRRQWIVDRFVDGVPILGDRPPDAVSRELGELLARLHSLPVDGFGLLRDRRDALRGQASDLSAGLSTRLFNPWPYGSVPLPAHAGARIAPALIPRLELVESRVRAVLDRGTDVLNHTDLHGEQILARDGHLAALLDFGDAAIGPRGWDLASFALFHGWSRLPMLLIGYTADTASRRQLTHEALCFAIPLALHHFSMGEKTGQGHRIERTAPFLIEALDALVTSPQPGYLADLL